MEEKNNLVAYRMLAFPMTLSDVQDHIPPTANILKCNFSCSCAAADSYCCRPDDNFRHCFVTRLKAQTPLYKISCVSFVLER